MKPTIYLNGKKVTRKYAAEKLGKDTLDKHIREAAEGFRIDPYEQQSWYTGAGMLTIEFSV